VGCSRRVRRNRGRFWRQIGVLTVSDTPNRSAR
jgi:hypothetical protein